MGTTAKNAALSVAFAALMLLAGRSALAAGIICPLYCIDGPAACVFSDGSCDFACNQCLCEADGGQWNPGVSCPSSSNTDPLSSGEGIACPLYCIDGDAACYDADGSCSFACNQCICEATGGTWYPGVSCQ